MRANVADLFREADGVIESSPSGRNAWEWVACDHIDELGSAADARKAFESSTGKGPMKVFISFAAFTLMLTYAAPQSSPIAAGHAQTQVGSASGLELRNLDTHSAACTDFYQFACGTWIEQHPIAPDRQRSGRFIE